MNLNRIDKLVGFLLLICFVVAALLGFDPDSADEVFTQMAREHLTGMGVRFDAVGCTFHDSDNDGYRSCTYVVRGELLPLECSFLTCRVPKPSVWPR